jgi:hypothetical protein
VWRCTDDSIAAGQISLLAVAETLAAVSVYWWLAFHFDWHWFSLVSLIAAPVLLLRSEESVELGVEMLQLWAKRKKSDVGRWEKVMVDLLVGLVAGGAAYFLAQAWSPGHEGWASFWRAGVIGAFAFALAIAVEIAIAGAITITIALARGAVLRLIFGPSAATGALLRALFIRWFASLHFFFYGLKRLPCNWRENLLVIDLIHPPELLPQAGRVRNAFTVAGLWRAIACKTGFDKAYGIILIIAWYLPALAYRWSLKASAWLVAFGFGADSAVRGLGRLRPARAGGGGEPGDVGQAAVAYLAVAGALAAAVLASGGQGLAAFAVAGDGRAGASSQR